MRSQGPGAALQVPTRYDMQPECPERTKEFLRAFQGTEGERMSSCCNTPASKEKKFGVKVCRERECEHLKNTSGYGGAQERCHALGGNNSIMPGTLPCCIQDPAMAPETFLRQVSYSLSLDWEKSNPNIQRPGPKNCPATCPYKISEQGEVFGKTGAGRYEKKQGTIWKCAFSGGTLGWGLGGSCLCHVLRNPEQEAQIAVLKCVIQAGFANNTCWYGTCPDGVERCTVEDEICPVINLPRMQHGCPLWRIPAKLLPAPVISEPDKITREERSRIDKPKSGIKKEQAKPATPKKSEKPAGEKQAATKKRKKPRYVQSILFDFGPTGAIQQPSFTKQRRTAKVKDEPEPYVQHCCGTCGHHKGRKTFHESCPRLGELLFKGGTKSAKVLMEETAAIPCEHWIKKNACAACDNPCGNQFMPGKPCRNELAHVKTPAKKLVPDSHEDRITNIQAAQRKAHPSWKWEVWQIDKEKGDWLWEVCPTEAAAKNLKKNLEKNVGDPRKWEVRERKDEKIDLFDRSCILCIARECCENYGKPEKGCHKDQPPKEWLPKITHLMRASCPGHIWEVWKIIPGGEYVCDGGRTKKEANAVKERLQEEDKSSRFRVSKLPMDTTAYGNPFPNKPTKKECETP